jgi:hypothetical protein
VPLTLSQHGAGLGVSRPATRLSCCGDVVCMLSILARVVVVSRRAAYPQVLMQP